MMNVEEKIRIVKSIGEECIQDEELLNLLNNNRQPIWCDEFQPFEKLDITQGLMKIIKVNNLISAGFKVTIWIADWQSFLNNKLGGDLKKIRTDGEKSVEIWKAGGMNLGDNVEFLWASDEINKKGNEYWPLTLNIARRITLSEITSEQNLDELTAGQIVNQCMQCADIFFLNADICQLDMEQQKLNAIARDYCDVIERKNKPIILPHCVLPGLKSGPEKMSESDPSSAIFMDDDEARVNSKIKKAYCPPNVVEGNPCLEYIKYIIFPWFKEFKIERKQENGGQKVFANFEQLISDYEKGDLHPADLKPALSKALNKILQPVRDHFKNKALLKKVKDSSKKGDSTKRVMSSQDGSSTLNQLMSVEEKYKIVRSIGEECIQDEELFNLIYKKPHAICYDGFEPSGRMHIGQGILKTVSVNKLTSTGCKMKIWIADWFAQLNNKMNGDLDKIRDVGNCLIEIWKASGMNIDENNVEFIWSSDEINSRTQEYWPLVMDIARRNSARRIIRCCQIMGRSEQDKLTVAQIFYPCMQCADIFFLKADICQLGMDQRKVNVLAREYCDYIKRKNKPIILSHHMLPGLKMGQEKMSKSDPSSAIFMEDEEHEVNSKITEAYCPTNIVEGNPCIEYIKYIVFPWFNEFTVERNEENGGQKIFMSYEELIGEYEKGDLQPAVLKQALSKALNRILQPVRDHFKNDEKAKALLEKVKGYKVTR